MNRDEQSEQHERDYEHEAEMEANLGNVEEAEANTLRKDPYCTICEIFIETGEPKHNGHLIVYVDLNESIINTICEICECLINDEQLFCKDINHVKIHHNICCPTELPISNTICKKCVYTYTERTRHYCLDCWREFLNE